MSLKLFLTVFALFLCPLLGLGQIDDPFSHSGLIQKYKAYFEQDRKAIYLHLNKTTFVSGEHIWFASYLYNRKRNEISLKNEYVYVQLIDNQGLVITSGVVLCQNGSGSGELELDDDLESGDYYLQAYTATMNNLIEDESTIYKIRILNFASQQETVDPISNDSLIIQLQPESGTSIYDVFGTFGIGITDKNNWPVNVDSIFLQKAQNGPRIPIVMDSLAMGKFFLTPKKGIRPTITAFYNTKMYSVPIPEALDFGYSLSAVHDFRKKQLLVAINTNSKTIEEGEDNLTLLVHKDGNIFPLAVTIDPKKARAELIIPYDMLFPGINTLTVIGNDSLPLAERMVFNRPGSQVFKPKLFNTKKSNDSITLFIKSNTTESQKGKINSFSISVLPDENIPHDKSKAWYNTFFLDTHLPKDVHNKISAFEPPIKIEDLNTLDNVLLLNGKSKYQWSRILNWKGNKKTPLCSNITGYVNTFGADNDSLSVILFSKANRIFSSDALDKNAKFKFEEISLAEKSEISLTLLNKFGKPIYANFFFTVSPGDISYNKTYLAPTAGLQEFSSKPIDSSSLLFKKVEQLNEVVVTENRLRRQNILKEYYGRKVDSTMLGYITLGGYMKRMGLSPLMVDTFHPDPRRAGTIQLAKKTPRGGIRFPSVVINGNYSAYAMLFADIGMEQIDEIYFQRGSITDAGRFVIFTKDGYGKPRITESEKNSKNFVVKNGFNLPKPFLRPTYYNLEDSLYKHYGVVSWHPNLAANESGLISIKIPDDGQHNLKLNVFGFEQNGIFMSESIDVDLETFK